MIVDDDDDDDHANYFIPFSLHSSSEFIECQSAAEPFSGLQAAWTIVYVCEFYADVWLAAGGLLWTVSEVRRQYIITISNNNIIRINISSAHSSSGLLRSTQSPPQSIHALSLTTLGGGTAKETQSQNRFHTHICSNKITDSLSLSFFCSLSLISLDSTPLWWWFMMKRGISPQSSHRSDGRPRDDQELDEIG